MLRQTGESGHKAGSILLRCAVQACAAILALGSFFTPQTRAQDRIAAIAPEAPAQVHQQPRKIDSELAQITARIRVNDETLARLRREAESLAADRAALSGRLVESTRIAQDMAGELAALEGRLQEMAQRETALRASLDARNETLSQLLASLQKLGRSPPPALLVQPDDAVDALRSAMLLGAVVPRARDEAGALSRELADLQSLSAAIETAKTAYAARLQQRRDEDARIESLIRQRQQAETASRKRIDALTQRAQGLSAQADSLESLVAALDAGAQALAGDQAEVGYDIDRIRQSMPEISTGAAFSTLKGVLTLPVAGDVQTGFGAPDKIGNPMPGMIFAAMPGGRVVAPADAKVLYSGEFRSYRQLLILDMGDGYHIVLAGMAEIDVEPGQFVLAGEPVARMSAQQLASVDETAAMPAVTETDSAATAGPMLYVEFRKNGQPVDPAPWWAERPSGRTRNDT